MVSKICLNCMNKKKDKDEVCPICGVANVKEANEPWHLEPGTFLKERYLIGRSIGYGGFGVTYIAYDMILQLKVAVKEYLPSEFATRMPGVTKVSIYAGEREEQYNHGLKGFMDEARKLAKFTENRGIVKIQDFFEENETAYLVMEYIEGMTLKTYLANEGGKISFDEALSILMPVIDALCEVHKTGIIHRDISPDNILITKYKEVKLIDFGAARYATTGNTKSLSVILKPGYAPEEQYRSRGDQGPWSDIYALGATLYKMITGIVPEESLERVMADEVKAPSDLGINLPENAEIALMNALAIKAYNRYQSMEEFRDYITGNKEAEIINRQDVVDIRRKKKKKKRRLIYTVTSMLLVAAIISGIFILNRNQRAKEAININKDSNEVNTPDIIGKTKDDGKSILEERNLGFLIVGKQNSDKVTKDLIMIQSPKSGKLSAKGTVIEVVISAGKIFVEMIDVSYMMKEDALALLEDLGIIVNIIEVDDEYAIKDQIVGQSIKSGEEIEAGTIIEIQVAKGKEESEIKEVEVPDITNLSIEEARAVLQELGLALVKVGEEYSQDIEVGKILSQDIKAGATITNDQPINVVVSLGQEVIQVTDVQYKSEEEAIASLEEQGLIVKVNYEFSEDVQEGKVISQSIMSGTEVDPATEITITVSKGKEDSTITFEDQNLEAVIREAIGKPNGDIYSKDVEGIKELHARSRNIKSLEGIQYLTRLIEIDVSNNQISDISPISNLNNLIHLNLGRYNANVSINLNGVSALRNMSNLQLLDLAGYNVSDISIITNLTNLTYLNLYRNNVSDISGIKNLSRLTFLNLNNNKGINNISELGYLKSLGNLYLDGNNISDVSALSGLTKLKELTLANNNISDYTPLSNLSNLTLLELDGDGDNDDFEYITGTNENEVIRFADSNLEAAIRNKIGKSSGDIYTSDVISITELSASQRQIVSLEGIENLTGLRKLDLGFNSINDISYLSELTNLTELNLDSNNISDIDSLKTLDNLNFLHIGSNNIQDISAIEKMTKLTEIHAQANEINDLSAFTNLYNLIHLKVWGNNISDITPIKDLTNLRYLFLDGNKVNDITPLEKLTNLECLFINAYGVTDGSPMKNLKNLTELACYDISDVSFLSELTNLKMLHLAKNNMTDLNVLENLVHLESLRLVDNKITDYSPLKKLNLKELELDGDDDYNDWEYIPD